MGEGADPDTDSAMESEVDDEADAEEATRRRTGRTVGIVIGIALPIVVAVGLLLLLGGERATQQSDEEALDRVRTADTSGTTTSAAGPDAFTAPAPGVYAYTGSGEEVTSFPPLTEQQGPDMPASVTAGEEGCWVFRLDYNTHHWQDWQFCVGDDGVTDAGGHSFARRDFVTFQIDNTSTFVCDPPVPMLWPDMAPGDTRQARCEGTSEAVEGTAVTEGTMTFVGTEPVDVGGTSIDAVHLRRDNTFTGAQTGTELVDWWLDPRTGLPLRNERAIVVHTATPVGDITYTEDGRFELTSLEPRT